MSGDFYKWNGLDGPRPRMCSGKYHVTFISEILNGKTSADVCLHHMERRDKSCDFGIMMHVTELHSVECVSLNDWCSICHYYVSGIMCLVRGLASSKSIKNTSQSLQSTKISIKTAYVYYMCSRKLHPLIFRDIQYVVYQIRLFQQAAVCQII